MRRSAHIAALFALTTLVGCGETASTGQQPEPRPSPAQETGRANHFAVEPFARGFNRPTWVGTAPGDTAVWVLEQPGRVLRLDAERRTVALDMTDGVALGAEQGLLGLAFHPDFAVNRLLYLHWSAPGGDTPAAEFRAGPDGTIVPRATASCSTSTSPRRTTTVASSLSAPTGGCTSASAMAAAPSTRSTTLRTLNRCSARSWPRRSTASRTGRSS